jgi:hypothetical protein
VLALVAANLAALGARQRTVGAVDAPLGAVLALALAQDARLVAGDLTGADAAPDALAVRAVVAALRERLGRDAEEQSYDSQKKCFFHRLDPSLKWFCESGIFAGRLPTHRRRESKSVIHPEACNCQATTERVPVRGSTRVYCWRFEQCRVRPRRRRFPRLSPNGTHDARFTEFSLSASGCLRKEISPRTR